MDTKKLRQKILDLAIHGKLVPQDPNDEPASVLLERIRAEKEQLMREGKIKAPKKSKTAGDTSHYGKEGPWKLPEGWEWKCLAEVGTWQSGSTPSRGVSAYYGGTIPWLKTGDLNDGYITNIPEHITDKALAETSVKLNPAGSVLIAMYGATIGKMGILTFPATTNQACCACSGFNGVSNKYLFYFLLSHREAFIRQGGGGAQPNISKEIIINTPIPIPPEKEQERIVNAIEKWSNLISQFEDAEHDLHNSIDSCKAKVLELAIHGKLVHQDPNDEPAIELLKRVNPGFRPSDNLHYEDGIPDGWLLCTLGDVSDYGQCKSVPVDEIDDDAWVLELEDIEKDTGKVLQRLVKKERNSCGTRHQFKTGQVLYSKLRTYLNKVFVTDEDGFCTTEIIPITPIDGVDPVYLSLVLRSQYFLDYSAQCGYGVKMPRMGTQDARKAVVPIPPTKEQIRIVDKTKRILAELETIASLNAF